MSERETISLQELNLMVQFAIRRQLPDSYWITAELNEARVGSGGHCYIEFIEKNEKGNIPVAKARGNIWANNYRILSRKFEEQTGMTISAGLKVMVNVTVEFHELYGYSLNVIDIDPSYTLGDLFMKRQEIIRRLEEEGVIDMNRELDFPLVPQRVAVISSPTAAGYGDFRNQIENNPYNIKFDLTLFPAVMQGEQVEKSIIAALDAIYERADNFDVVVIIRGGGANSDLTGFDSYNLAFHCTQFPLPIVSGIGHERDRTVLDAVANVSVKTPTAAAQYLITAAHDFAEEIKAYAVGIQTGALQKLSSEKLWQLGLVSSFNKAASGFLHAEKMAVSSLASDLKNSVALRISTEKGRIVQFDSNLPLLVRNVTDRQRNAVENSVNRLNFAVSGIVREEKHRLDIYGQVTRNTDPKRIMERGFVVLRHKGKALRRKGELVSGGHYNLETSDGNINITINEDK